MPSVRLAKRSAVRGSHVAKPSARVAKLLGLLLVPAAVVATGLTVASASYSAFNATTSASGGSFTTGTVLLNNDASTNFLSLSNLKPGQLPRQVRSLPLSTLAATNSFSNGITAWTSSGGTDTRAFRFTPSVASGILNSLQAATTTVGFTWEAQNS